MPIQPMAHQRKAIQYCADHARWGHFLDPGCGKTLALLWAHEANPIRTLVLAPKSVLGTAWKPDAAKIGIDLPIIRHASKGTRKAMIGDRCWSIAATNYEMFKTHREDFWKAGVRRLIIDESSKIRNWNSQITKTSIWFSDQIESVYLLSGTPAPNHAAEYWAQVRCIDRTKSGNSYFGFEARYTVPIKSRVWVNGQPRDVTTGHYQTDAQRDALVKMLATCSWTLRAQDCIDLPAERNIFIPIELGSERGPYESCEKSLAVEVENETFNVNASAALIKLRQITGGSVNLGGSRVSVGSAKLDALNDLLDSLGSEPVVVVAEFTAEIDSIVQMVKDRSETVATIDGRTSGESAATVAAFQAGQVRVLVIQPQSAAHGVTLTRSRYTVFYSLGFSAELYTQARKRIHRIGQERDCCYYHLLTERTVDHAAYRVCTGKVTASDAIRAMLADHRSGKPRATPVA